MRVQYLLGILLTSAMLLSAPQMVAAQCETCDTMGNRQLSGGGWLCDEDQDDCHQWPLLQQPSGIKYWNGEDEPKNVWLDGPCTNCCSDCNGGERSLLFLDRPEGSLFARLATVSLLETENACRQRPALLKATE